MRRPEHVYLLEPDLFPDVTSRLQNHQRPQETGFFSRASRELYDQMVKVNA